MTVMPLGEVPVYNEDEDRQSALAAVEMLRDAIATADGLVVISPEYNHGISGVLKNAIDWVSRPASDIPRVFGDLPVAYDVHICAGRVEQDVGAGAAGADASGPRAAAGLDIRIASKLFASWRSSCLAAAGDEPFFLYVAHHSAHHPLNEPPQWIAPYEESGGSIPKLAPHLFRLEVHDVSPDGTSLTLKWSTENGALAYGVKGLPAGFLDERHVLEEDGGIILHGDDEVGVLLGGLELIDTLAHTAAVLIGRQRSEEERRAAEAAAGESEQRFRALTESHPDGMRWAAQ